MVSIPVIGDLILLRNIRNNNHLLYLNKEMSKYLLGIEVRGSQVKIAVLKKDRRLKLISVQNLNLPLGDASYEMLSEWVSKKFSSDDEILGAISVSESSIFLEKVKLPSIKKDQLDEALYWELSSVASFPISEAAYDWKISTDNKTTYALVALAKSAYIENWVSLFEKCGVKIRVIEPSSISFSRLAKIDFSKRTLSLVVEENSTDLVIMENKIPIFSTSINISVSSSKSDRRKLNEDVSNEIAQSAKKIVLYWQEKEGKTIEQATITGYIANKYFGLASAINRFLGVPVVIARSRIIPNFVHTDFNENSLEQNMVCIGCAMVLADERYVLLNLLTYDRKKTFDREKKENDSIKRITTFFKINIGLTLVLLLYLSLIIISNRILVGKVYRLENFVKQHPSQKISQQVKENNKMFALINDQLYSYENISDKINLINSLTPLGLTYVSVDYKNVKDGQWTIKGKGTRNEIIAFYSKLEKEANATNIKMPLSNFNENQTDEFEIIISW